SGTGTTTGTGTVGVLVTPGSATLSPYGTATFTSSVTNAANTAVTWEVNGVVGGNATTGIISTSGVYNAPHAISNSILPAAALSATVTITAVSQASATAKGTAIVTLVTQEQETQSGAVKLGTSGGNVGDTSANHCCSGTLGALLTRNGTLYVLSNNHVLARSDAGVVGDSVSQPGIIETNCQTAGTQTVANLTEFFNLETGPAPKIDAALAQVVNGTVDSSGNILLLGGTQTNGVPDAAPPHGGTGITPAQALAAPHNALVAKSGRTTGLTCSTIVATNVAASVDYYRHCADTAVGFTVGYTDLISVSGGDFSGGGDSGSLIVTQDSADPVALLFGGSDTDSVGNPVGDVLADFPGSGNVSPTFVGGAPHAVIGCSLRLANAAAAKFRVNVESMMNAERVRDFHAPELLADSRVRAVGVGSSYDQPGQAAILLVVGAGTSTGMPGTIDGVRTQIISGSESNYRGMLSDEETREVVNSTVARQVMYATRAGEYQRAQSVRDAHVNDLLKQPGVLGVGLTSSLDAPGEAAVMIYVARGQSEEGIPASIDGVRTRIRQSSRFTSGRRPGEEASAGCRVPVGKKAESMGEKFFKGKVPEIRRELR
ncbi:MAG: S1 family peptidase, partial [Acidobacteriota bacterium]|nr:S1 family peptidase [Acidobacteriota bacterium]